MKFVAEGSILLLEASAVCLLLFVTYIIYLRHWIEREERTGSGLSIVLRGASFILLAALALEVARMLASEGRVLHAFAVLVVGWLGTVFVYFTIARKAFDDDRIRYTLILLAALGQLTCAFLIGLWWAGDRLNFEEPFKIDGQALAQMINNAMQIIGVVIAAAMIVVTNLFNSKQASRNARQQIYQTLELQSIELFRFEADHPELVEEFWFADNIPDEERTKGPRGLKVHALVSEYQVKQYICQMLNLFEMAFRFRKENIVPADVFGSWVIWMWELCCEPRFAKMWYDAGGLKYNYIGDFRDAMSKGVDLATQLRSTLRDQTTLTPEGQDALRLKARDDFAECMAEKIGNCKVLADWFNAIKATSAAGDKSSAKV